MTRKYTSRKMTESQEQQVGQDSVREFVGDEELNKPKSETMDGHHLGGELERIGFDANGKRIRSKKWHEEMAFMNEIVTVRVHPTTDKNANPIPDVYVNGRVQRFVRGEEVKCRRCFVEVLARAKSTTFDNLKTKGPDGEDKYVYPSHTAEVFPFVVIGDSPKGEAWLKRVLAEA